MKVSAARPEAVNPSLWRSVTNYGSTRELCGEGSDETCDQSANAATRKISRLALVRFDADCRKPFTNSLAGRKDVRKAMIRAPISQEKNVCGHPRKQHPARSEVGNERNALGKGLIRQHRSAK